MFEKMGNWGKYANDYSNLIQIISCFCQHSELFLGGSSNDN